MSDANDRSPSRPAGASSDVTELLGRLGTDDGSVAAQLLPLVYDELRALAQSHFARQSSRHTLQATALVHEVYLKLARGAAWSGRDHFFAVAAQAMRQVLVDHARRKRAEKRDGGRERVELAEGLARTAEAGAGTVCDVLDLEEALERLAALAPRKAQVVTLRFYGGLTNEAVAEAIGIARATVADDWAFARAWLAKELSKDAAPAPKPSDPM
jgi:RNA polymerase sigma factor (TIGR02999 family)